jgi:hypothetical protein
MRFAISMAPSTEVAVPSSGCCIFSFLSMLPNSSRSSARSIADGDVPRIFTPACSSGIASFSGV